ncbi:MAG: hypothetical protein EHM64_01415 [Ignavibacteriae bacterium]|nr:MAG: hypothetical protein EHM64_01415 [Ignavibacteriota bacterium]
MKKFIVHLKAYFAGSIWRKRLLFSFIGALGGYAYYYYIGCASGTCPISSNPWISTFYGAGMGLVLTMGDRSKAPAGSSEPPKE